MLSLFFGIVSVQFHRFFPDAIPFFRDSIRSISPIFPDAIPAFWDSIRFDLGKKMSTTLKTNTLKKIFREHFKGETPIVKYGSEQKVLISEIKQKLRTMKGYTLSNNNSYPRYTKTELEEICLFEILPPSEDYRNQEFTLQFNEQNQLYIEQWYRLDSLVYDLEQIYTLFDRMKLEYERLGAVQIKTQKIKGLKHTAIIAKINQIAIEDKFEFRLEKHFATKIKLIVRITDLEKMEIDIPYSKFQETLQNLRFTIQTIRELRKSDITFKIRKMSRSESEYGWSSYDNDEDEVNGYYP
jgi:hypothetical protein